MSKFIAILIEHGSGIAGAVIAWVVGYIFIREEEFVRLGLDIAGYFFGLAVSATWRFESLIIGDYPLDDRMNTYRSLTNSSKISKRSQQPPPDIAPKIHCAAVE